MCTVNIKPQTLNPQTRFFSCKPQYIIPANISGYTVYYREGRERTRKRRRGNEEGIGSIEGQGVRREKKESVRRRERERESSGCAARKCKGREK